MNIEVIGGIWSKDLSGFLLKRPCKVNALAICDLVLKVCQRIRAGKDTVCQIRRFQSLKVQYASRGGGDLCGRHGGAGHRSGIPAGHGGLDFPTIVFSTRATE